MPIRVLFCLSFHNPLLVPLWAFVCFHPIAVAGVVYRLFSVLVKPNGFSLFFWLLLLFSTLKRCWHMFCTWLSSRQAQDPGVLPRTVDAIFKEYVPLGRGFLKNCAAIGRYTLWSTDPSVIVFPFRFPVCMENQVTQKGRFVKLKWWDGGYVSYIIT